MAATDAAPVAAPARRERLRAPVATVGALAAATLALRLRDPHVGGSWGVCPTALVGLACPFCGGLRGVNDLTHSDLAAAASSNLLVVLAAPFVVVVLLRWTVLAWRGPQRGTPALPAQPVLYAGVVVLIVFTVLRNLPGSWLAP